MERPFEDSAKLRILNAKYTIPESDTKYTVFHDLISECIVPLNIVTIIVISNFILQLADSFSNV